MTIPNSDGILQYSIGESQDGKSLNLHDTFTAHYNKFDNPAPKMWVFAVFLFYMIVHRQIGHNSNINTTSMWCEW